MIHPSDGTIRRSNGTGSCGCERFPTSKSSWQTLWGCPPRYACLLERIAECSLNYHIVKSKPYVLNLLNLTWLVVKLLFMSQLYCVCTLNRRINKLKHQQNNRCRFQIHQISGSTHSIYSSGLNQRSITVHLLFSRKSLLTLAKAPWRLGPAPVATVSQSSWPLVGWFQDQVPW